MAALLEVRDVDAGYGATPVLKGVSFTVAPGEAWAVLGPNGAGKSTLVRLVMGLVRPRRGWVRRAGDGAGRRARARSLAWVPQTIGEDTAFTALEVALMGRAPHLGAWGLPGSHDVARALAALDELGVLHLAQRPLAEVSGGERRRVWLARALVQDPQLLVLDEPTAFLDVRHQVDTLRAVRRRLSPGPQAPFGVLAVLHDVNLAAHFATHALLLRDGACLAQGPVAEVLSEARLSALYDIALKPTGAGGFAPEWPW